MRVEVVVHEDTAAARHVVERPARTLRDQVASRHALIPEAPEGKYPSRQQLNVRISDELHWALRASSFLSNDSMSSVITKFLGAYAQDPKLWLDLFTLAEGENVPLAEVLNPAVREALTGLLEEA